MKKSIRLFPLILISLLSFDVSCTKETQEGNIEVIINESKPQNPSFYLKFEEDLSITEEGWYPVDIAVDDEENIYVFGEKEMFIYKYDSQGNEIFKKVFPKGQGPGEFYFMDSYFSSDGRLFLYDKLLRRVTILNKTCEIQDSIKTTGTRYLLRLDSKGNMFFWRSKALFDTKDERKYTHHILSKFSPTDKLLYEIFEYRRTPFDFDEEKVTFYIHLYSPCGFYKLDSDDNVYCTTSDKYEINVVSPQGKLFKKIIKKGKSRRATQKDIDKVSYRMEPYKVEYIAPEYMPCIADFFILDNKYLLVITFENDYDEEALAGDLFDDKGIYQARVEVPKYWWWYTLFIQLKNQALYKNNHFYTIEADEYEEHVYVKRYRMIWGNK